MLEFINQCIEAMRKGVTFGVDGFALYFYEGKFYIEEPMVYEGTDEIHEEDTRRRLDNWYSSNPDLMEIDREYLLEVA